jgi:hypothetical protein
MRLFPRQYSDLHEIEVGQKTHELFLISGSSTRRNR